MKAEKRDCENCKHHKEVFRGGIFYHSCEAWDCTFEPTEEGKEAIEKNAGIEQIIWERDLAIQQLKSLGYGLGEKPKENKGDPNGEWIPIKTRPLTEEEKEYYKERGAYYFDSIFDCHLPEDGQEVLITTNNGAVEKVAFYNEGDDGSYFENYEGEGEVLAWQPLPEPYKPESEGE